MSRKNSNSRLEYLSIGGDSYVNIFEVRIPGVEDNPGGNSWGGRLGYRAQKIIKLPVYEPGSRTPIATALLKAI